MHNLSHHASVRYRYLPLRSSCRGEIHYAHMGQDDESGHRVALGKELPQRWIDLFLIRDGHGSKLWVKDFVVGRHQRAGRAIMSLANLAVAKDVTEFH